MADGNHLTEQEQIAERERAKRKATAKELKIDVKRIRANTHPPHEFFNVVIKGIRGEWSETVGSEADLNTLLQGIRAGVGMMGGHMSVNDLHTQTFYSLSATADFAD